MIIDLEALGLHGSVLLAGFSGGVSYIGVQEGKVPLRAAFLGVIVSTLAANYLSVVATDYLFKSNSAPELASAFIVGVGAPWVIRGIVRRARAWGGSNGNGSDSGNQGTPK